MNLRKEVTDMLRDLFTPLPKPVEIPPNVVRISNIPHSLLPDMSAARDDLLALAWAGKDVDAYQPAASCEWVIWCKPGDGMPGDGRYTVEQWQAIHEREYYRLLPPDTQKEEVQA